MAEARTVAVTMVRNESDVIHGVLRHMADEVDWIIVADNLSDDGTRDILRALEGDLPITVVDDDDPAYYQSVKMTRLAAMAAADHGATWIVPFDADEVWYTEARIRDALAAVPDDVGIVAANLYNHFATAIDLDPATDAGVDVGPGAYFSAAHPFVRMVWRMPAPAPLPKVAFRWEDGAVIHQGNHGVALPSGRAAIGGLEVRHFPYRSGQQFINKAKQGARAYALTTLPTDMGSHWRSYGEIYARGGEAALLDVWRAHFWHQSPVDAGMICDPAPFLRWQR